MKNGPLLPEEDNKQRPKRGAESTTEIKTEKTIIIKEKKKRNRKDWDLKL